MYKGRIASHQFSSNTVPHCNASYKPMWRVMCPSQDCMWALLTPDDMDVGRCTMSLLSWYKGDLGTFLFQLVDYEIGWDVMAATTQSRRWLKKTWCWDKATHQTNELQYHGKGTTVQQALLMVYFWSVAVIHLRPLSSCRWELHYNQDIENVTWLSSNQDDVLLIWWKVF